MRLATAVARRSARHTNIRGYALPDLRAWPATRLIAAGVLLSLATHLPLAIFRLFDLGYDAAIHTFFAGHYLRTWWDLWEPRWYTGFSVASYPPLAHQLMALIALPLGQEAAYPVLLLVSLAGLPAAMYAFARGFVSERPAGYAALLSGLTPATGLVAYPFGQLPFLFGTVLALATLGALSRYLRSGRTAELVLTALLAGATAAAHHLTYGLLLPAGGLALAARSFMERTGHRRLTSTRLALSALAGLSGALTIIPFWLWLGGYVQQAPIDHPSRHNLLGEPDLQRLFLWPMYGVLPLVLLANIRDLGKAKLWPLVSLVAFLAVVGLGGTTPLPWLLYGSWASWLTFDRFSGWAAFAALPLAGLTMAALMEGPHRLPISARWTASMLVVAGFGGSVVWAATIPLFTPVQPPSLDLTPVARFLDEGDHARWRYLTLGFGDQMARLGYLTTAASVDGSYHTARTLPELRQSGIGQIDGALHWDPEGRTLLEMLSHANRYHLRWTFVNDRAYTPFLEQTGWKQVTTFSNGVELWQMPDVSPLGDERPSDEALLPWWQGALWGTVPLMTFAASGLVALMLARRRENPL